MRFQSTLFVLLAAAVTSCAPDQPAREATVHRLIEELRRAEIQTPEGANAERPESARRTRLVRPTLRDHLARIALDRRPEVAEERLALFGPVGTLFRYRLQLPPGAHLRFGIGTPSPSAEAQPVQFIIRAGSPGDTKIVFDRQIDGGSWVDADIPIDTGGSSPRSDQKTILELTTSGATGESRWAAWSSPEVLSAGRRQDGWDVVLISLDTLRADRLSCYGYERPTSPFLDDLAARGIRFSTPVSAAPWTLPAHRALFTGLYPLSRGDLRARPLAEVLWREGYWTEAVTGGGVMDFRIGFGRGFDSYRLHDWIRELDTLAGALAVSPKRKRFLFLHTYEPHDPYIHTELAADLPSGRLDGYFDKETWRHIRHSITAEEKAYIEALYDSDIAFTDTQLKALFQKFEEDSLLERAIVIVTSDHGEQFWEHGYWRHGQNLYDHQLLVPLILHLPQELRRRHGIPRGGLVIEQQVRLIDVYPTLLELLEIDLGQTVQGRSLVPLLRGEFLPDIEALAEDLNISNAESKALRFRGYKFIRSRRLEATAWTQIDELYALGRDEKEQINLVDSQPERAAAFRQRLELLAGGTWDEKRPSLEEQPLDPDLKERLEALGYLGN